jgi:hypothetical protein
MSIKFLKVKIKSLAAEAKIIKLEEDRAWAHTILQGQLHSHRVVDVRREQRSTLLAYAFLRGRRYADLERVTHSLPDWRRIARIVQKYGAKVESMKGGGESGLPVFCYSTSRPLGEVERELEEWFNAPVLFPVIERNRPNPSLRLMEYGVGFAA